MDPQKPSQSPLPLPDSGIRRVLVIQTAFLGDIVLTTSFLANLRRLLPAAEIRILTTPAGVKILEGNAYGAAAIAYDKRGREAGTLGFWRKAKELRAFAPDLVFCLHRSLRSVLLAWLAGGDSWGFQEAAGSALFLKHRIVRLPGAFEAEKNHGLLRAWAGESADGLPLFPQLSTSNEGELEAQKVLGGLPTGFLALAPSSVWATKRWPARYFAAVAHELWRRHRIAAVIVGGRDPADLESARDLLEAYRSLAAPGEPLPLDLCGKTGLAGMKSVLSRAALVLANDSAPLHVALSVGAKAVGIFGPTTRDLGFFPLAPAGRSSVAELPGLDCRPCGLHGHRVCPRGHFRCMLDLKPEMIVQEAEKLLCQ
jgi:heptosyltransferase II